MGVTAGIFLASILLKEMRYLVYIRYLCGHLSLADEPFQRHTPSSGEKMGVAGTLSDNCAVIYIAHFLPSIALFAQLILPFLQRALLKGMDQSIRFTRWRLFFKIFKTRKQELCTNSDNLKAYPKPNPILK